MTDVWYIPAAVSLVALLFAIWWTLIAIKKIKEEKDGINK